VLFVTAPASTNASSNLSQKPRLNGPASLVRVEPVLTDATDARRVAQREIMDFKRAALRDEEPPQSEHRELFRRRWRG
jgi:hypothetical protein